MKRLWLILPSLFLLGSLTGCPTTPTTGDTTATSQSLQRERNLSTFYTAIGAVADTTAILLENRIISKQEATNVFSIAQAAKSSADIALQSFKENKTADAEAQLKLAQNVLKEAQSFLAARQPISLPPTQLPGR